MKPLAILIATLTAGVCIAVAGRADAQVEHVVSGAKISIKTAPSGSKLVLVFDAPFVAPDLGSSSDPSVNPLGLILSVLSPVEGVGTLVAPGSGADPGWKTKSGRNGPVYRFKHRSAPDVTSQLRTISIKTGRRLRIIARGSALPMAAPHGLLAVRITTGSIDNCAVFKAVDIKVDEAGRFKAKLVANPTITDCSTESLLGQSCGGSAYPTCGGSCADGGACVPDIYGGNCSCVFPSQPCGDTTPACNGTCPVGETCAAFGTTGYPLNTCGCVPDGSTPCGSPGLPVCGGACPVGKVCGGVQPFDLFPTCDCVDPVPCGATSGICPSEEICFDSGATNLCVPIFCSGTYPTCGGPCEDGGTCLPITAGSPPVDLCACGLP